MSDDNKRTHEPTQSDNDQYIMRKRHKKSSDHFLQNSVPHDVHAYRVPNIYEDSIFIAGEKEVHFNAHIDNRTIVRMKKLISSIVFDNKDQLVKFDADKKIPAGREKDSDVVITYIVNSPGGSVHDVLDFVDYINHLRDTFSNIKFTSIITGMVASAGTVMCIIADTRQMTRFSFAMIHELSSGLSRENYTHIMTYAEFIKNVHDTLVTIYQENRGIDPKDQEKKKELENLLKDQVWMSPEKYKELGFVDEIISNNTSQKKNYH